MLNPEVRLIIDPLPENVVRSIEDIDYTYRAVDCQAYAIVIFKNGQKVRRTKNTEEFIAACIMVYDL